MLIPTPTTSPRDSGHRHSHAGSPRTAYICCETGAGSDAESMELRNTHEGTQANFDPSPTWRRKLRQALHSIVPWGLSLLLGVLTALTGSLIALSSDFLSDMRFGFCSGIPFADRKLCCGGSENVNLLNEHCIAPALNNTGPVHWVPWTEFFGFDTLVSPILGSVLKCLVYVASSVFWTVLAALLVAEYCPQARGSGIPETKAAVSGFDLPQSFSNWCLVIKSLGLSLAVGAGLSLGKEGPMIQIGVCWAYMLQRICVSIGLPREIVPLHEVASVGAAAGVSAAFGAPLGGVLFAAEELGSVRSLSRRTLILAFLAAFAASFTLKYLNLNGANKLTLFVLSQPTHTAGKEWVASEMVAFLVTGLLGGLVGALFIKVNLTFARERRRCVQLGRIWLLPDVLSRAVLRPFTREGARPSFRALSMVEGAILGLITSVMSYPVLLLRTLSSEAIHGLFETCPSSRAMRFGLCSVDNQVNTSWQGACILLVAVCIRMLQTSFTFGAALPSGLFIPSLFIGAALGRFIGNTLHLILWHQSWTSFHVEPGMFAMVGAIATLSGFCRMTVSLVVIMFELTGELTYVVPFMCAVLAAKLVGDSLTPSIYDSHAQLNGYAPVEEQRDVRLDTIVADVSVTVQPGDCIDASAVLAGPALQALALAGVAANAEVFGNPSDSQQGGSHRSAEAAGQELPPLLVVDYSDGPSTASSIVGVVDRQRLLRWLHRQSNAAESSFCFVSARTPEPTPATPTGGHQAAAENGSSDRSSSREATVEDSPVSESGQLCSSQVVDASHLVDTRVVRLSPHAPLLTAYCAFRQKPKLQYCVCAEDRTINRFSVLSRADFETALTAKRFSLARAPYHVPGCSRRSVGAAAVSHSMSLGFESLRLRLRSPSRESADRAARRNEETHRLQARAEVEMSTSA